MVGGDVAGGDRDVIDDGMGRHAGGDPERVRGGERVTVLAAELRREALAAGTKRRGTTRQKAKFDDQIVAIAAVEGASVIYSDDEDIRKIAAQLEVKGMADLPLPPADAQLRMEFDSEPETLADDKGDETDEGEAR